MLILSSRASVAHHVLGLTLRRQRHLLQSHAGYSTAVAERVELGDPEWKPPTSLEPVRSDSEEYVESRAAKWDWMPKEEDKGVAVEEKKPRVRASGPYVAKWLRRLEAEHPVLDEVHRHNLLALPYLIPAEDILGPMKTRPDGPPHLPRSARPPYKRLTLLAPGPKPSEVIALPPPPHPLAVTEGFKHPIYSWKLLFDRQLEDVCWGAYLLLQETHRIRRETHIPFPNHVSRWYPHLHGVQRCIQALTPVGDGWNNLTRSRYHALLHLWQEYMYGLRTLHDMDGLHGTPWEKMTLSHQFNRLILLLTSDVLDVHHEPRDKRLRIPAPSNPPTLESMFALMADLGRKPTHLQLTTVLQKLPLSEIFARAKGSNAQHEAALNDVAKLIAMDLTHPRTLKRFREAPTQYGKYTLQERREYDFALSEAAMDELEASLTADGTPLRHWAAVIDVHRPQWINVAGRLAEERSNPDLADLHDWPSRLQMKTCWLLIRDALVRAPAKSLNIAPINSGDFDLGSPFDLLRLMLDTKKPIEREAFRAGWNYASTAIVRIARAAAKREMFAPALQLTKYVAERGFRIHLRTAVYLAGSARHPEDLVALLPSLARLKVYPPRNEESREVLSELLNLARQADREGHVSPIPDSAGSIKKDLVELFRSWGLPTSNPSMRRYQQHRRPKPKPRGLRTSSRTPKA